MATENGKAGTLKQLAAVADELISWGTGNESTEVHRDGKALVVRHARRLGRQITIVTPETGEPLAVRSRDLFDVFRRDAEGFLVLESRRRASRLTRATKPAGV